MTHRVIAANQRNNRLQKSLFCSEIHVHGLDSYPTTPVGGIVVRFVSGGWD